MSTGTLRPELLQAVWPWGAGAIASALAALLLGRALFQHRPARAVLRLGEAGTTELEFVLALSPFLVMVFTTIQLALLVNAQIVVDYAAYCAARSASVWVAQSVRQPHDPANAIRPERRSQKWQTISSAAWLACTPISPPLSSVAIERLGLAPQMGESELRQFLARPLIPRTGPSEFARLGPVLVDRSLYAVYNTEVTIGAADDPRRQTFGKTESLRVAVRHDYRLSVPGAAPVLGWALGRYSWAWGFQVPLRSSYTMMLWGTREAE